MDDKCIVGPLSKRARVALPWQGIHVDRNDKWKQSIIDALKVVNVEYHAIWTQFKGVQKALTELTYKVYIKGSKGSPRKQDEEQQGVEMRETGVGISEGSIGGQGGE